MPQPPAGNPYGSYPPAQTPYPPAQTPYPPAQTPYPPAQAAYAPATTPLPAVDPHGATAQQQPAAPQYGTPQYGTPQYGTPQYGTPQYGAQQYGSAQYSSPGYAPGYPGATPAKPKRNMLLFVIIGVVVLAVIVAVIVVFATRGSSTSSTGGTTHANTNTGTSSSASAGTASTATAAVQGYLNALAAGKAADALAYAAVQPNNTTFMTDAVLAQSNKLAPITNITVDSNGGGQVTATYSLGTHQVSATYRTEQIGGKYLLASANASVPLTNSYEKGIGMMLNGVPLDGVSLSSVALFPGTYQLTATNSMLVFDPGTFTVEDPDDYPFVDSDLDLATGADAILAGAAKTKLDACLAEKQLETSCGFGIQGLAAGATPDLSTVTWTITKGSDDFSNADWKVSYSSATTVTYDTFIAFNLKLKDTKGGQYDTSANFGIDPSISEVSVDISDPANPVVSFD